MKKSIARVVKSNITIVRLIKVKKILLVYHSRTKEKKNVVRLIRAKKLILCTKTRKI